MGVYRRCGDRWGCRVDGGMQSGAGRGGGGVAPELGALEHVGWIGVQPLLHTHPHPPPVAVAAGTAGLSRVSFHASWRFLLQ